jgi:hypothetical protein
MKKLLFLLILAVMSGSAMAEWVRVNYGSGDSATTYVNFFKIEKSGKTVKMWSLVDYKKPQERAFLPLYMSINRHSEFNCKEGQMRELYASYHAKNMGEGKVTFSDNTPDSWSAVLPDSIDRELWKYACKK